MLKITEDQLDALSEIPTQRIEAQLFEIARASFDACVRTMSDDALRARIHEDVAVARRFGIRSARGHIQFVTLALLSDAPRIYQVPQVAALLLAAGPRVEQALDDLVDDMIEIARRAADASPPADAPGEAG